MKIKTITFAVAFLLLYSVGSGVCKEVAPEIKRGVLDLSQHGFANGPVILNGEWEFYWNQLLDPQNPIGDQTGYFFVPNIWNKAQVGNKKLNGQGFATYRLKVILDKVDTPLAIRTLYMGTAFSLFINGKKVNHSGQVGTTPESSDPEYLTTLVTFIPKHKELDLVLHISNFHHKKGGARRHLIIGTATQIIKKRENAVALNLFLFGSIFIIGIYHFGFYFNRKSAKSTLYFSLLCFLIAIRNLVKDEIFLKSLFPNLPWEILIKIEYLSFFVSVPVFTFFLEDLFPSEFPKKLLLISRLISLIFVIVVIATQPGLYTHTSVYYELFTVIVCVACIFYLFRAAVNKRAGAKSTLVAMFVILCAIINDIMYNDNFFTESIDLIPFSILFFILLKAHTLSRLFGKSFIKIETLKNVLNDKSEELAQKNIKLSKYNERMDVLVKIRTSALNATLKEVEDQRLKFTNSLNYSKIIQTSILPKKETLKLFFPNSFFIWKPKDIVSGDMFFVDQVGENLIIGVIDCTGHGVPGAFMTMIASTAFQRIIHEQKCYAPDLILHELNKKIKTLLNQGTSDAKSDNGLDAALCYLEPGEKRLTFAGAGLPLVYFDNNDITVLKGNKHSIGYKRSRLDYKFTNHVVHLKPGMNFYLYSDGYIQQLGGAKGLGLGKKRLWRLLKEIGSEALDVQEYLIMQMFHDYRQEKDIQDDITFMGFSLDEIIDQQGAFCDLKNNL